MKTGFPAWLPAVIYLLVCLFFPSPFQNMLGLLAAFALFLSATTIGRLTGRIFQTGNRTLHFPLGLGLVLMMFFGIGSWNASQTIIVIVWLALGTLALPSAKELNQRVPWYFLWGLPFFVLSAWSSFTPTTFYDALAYNLGIPYQYIAYQRIGTFSTWTTSFFPPFDQIIKFLFIAVAPQNAIKIFSFLIYIHVLRMLNSVKNEDLDSKFIVIPLLLLPASWILLHIVNPDLLNCFFFVAAVCAILGLKNPRTIALGAVLLAFNAWTKYTIYPFLVFIPLLLWSAGNTVRQFVKRAMLLVLVFLIVMSPLYTRNIVLKNDPLYPLLGSVFSTDWQQKQTDAVQMEFPTPKNWKDYVKAVFLTPFLITFLQKNYGSASEIGFLPLIALLLIPIHYRKLRTPITAFVILCYLAWIYQLYHFRYFLPVYLVASLVLAYSFQRIGKAFPRGISFLWIGGTVWGLLLAAPVYRLFPLIQPAVSPEAYLSQQISYFDAARFLNKITTDQRTVMVGETRNAYFRVRLIPYSYTDQVPLLIWAGRAQDAKDLYRRLKEEEIGYILYNQNELMRLSRQYPIWQPDAPDSAKVTELLKEHGRILYSHKGVVLIQIE